MGPPGVHVEDKLSDKMPPTMTVSSVTRLKQIVLAQTTIQVIQVRSGIADKSGALREIQDDLGPRLAKVVETVDPVGQAARVGRTTRMLL